MSNPRDEFLAAAFWHGDRARCDALLAKHPEIATADIHTAAALGDDVAIARFLARDPSRVSTTSGPHDVEPIVTLCYSVYLKDREKSAQFVNAASLLFDAGARVDAGFFDRTHEPPSWESLMYGAAGVAFNPEMTRLLLARGVDPNDGETPYHAIEGPDNDAFRILVESGTMDRDSLATSLLRKADFHDFEGLELLLNHGVDPNYFGQWHGSALHQALRRDNDLENIDLLLDRGADPRLPMRPRRDEPRTPTAIDLAIHRGRADVLGSLARRGIATNATGVDALIEACALDDGPRIHDIIEGDPSTVDALRAEGSTLIAEFTATANTAGVARLLELGVPVDSRYAGDGYYGIAKGSTPLHIAAWRAWQTTLEFLIARGADVNAVNSHGENPLQLAVRATIDSWWKWRRTPDGVRALLSAGASKAGISLPTGYDEIDRLLSRSE